ncbi:MAG: hypothetical protein WDN28_32640 [Chthoniobacter sp.]
MSCQAEGVTEFILQKRDVPDLFRAVRKGTLEPVYRWTLADDKIAAAKGISIYSAEIYLASQLERLMALPLATQSDLKNWESERGEVEQTIREKFPRFEPSDDYWHFICDADIRLRDGEYRDRQHKLIAEYITILRERSRW